MRNKKEIGAEIEALRGLKPAAGIHAKSVAERIRLCIEELEFGVDDTAAEWWELNDSEQDAVMEARRWKEGDNEDRPSTGWGELVK